MVLVKIMGVVDIIAAIYLILIVDQYKFLAIILGIILLFKGLPSLFA